MFCSTIIPTINRSTLSRAVRSVLDQRFRRAGFEVIVVNDSGQPLPDMDWQYSEQVQVINTNRRERSVARNTGAAIAKGKYLHFLDDDDLLLPDALDAFWALDQASQVAWLNGSYQTVDNNGTLIEEIHPEIEGNCFALLTAGEGIPLQASLIKSDQFYAAGAFDAAIVGVEDRDLGRRVALVGKIAYTAAVVAKIRIGQQGSTTNWARIAEDDRWGREKAISAPCAFERLRDSADSCSLQNQVRRSYWHGRVCRAYTASMFWNLTSKNGLVAAARAGSAISFAGLHPFSQDFWRGLMKTIEYEAAEVYVSPARESWS